MQEFNQLGQNIATTTPQIIVQSKESIWPSAFGAFFGAFFAFSFGLAAFYIQKKLERYWKHKNAVVEIEHTLQDNLDQNSANQYLLKGAISTLQRNHLTYTLLTALRLSEDINLRIGDIDVLNRYIDYKEPVVKVNHGMVTWQGMNQQLHQAVTANPNLPAPIVHKTLDNIQKMAESLLQFMIGLDTDTEYLLGYIRIYMRKDKHIWSKWWYKMRNKTEPFISEKEIQKEIKVLQGEIEKVTKKSRERIEKIMNS